MEIRSNASLSDLLKAVSRSFSLTLKVLPGGIRPQIGLAYLLARATDTVADTDAVSLDLRLEALHALRNRILGVNKNRLDFGQLSRRQTSTAEGVLLERIEDCLALLQTLGPDDLRSVQVV